MGKPKPDFLVIGAQKCGTSWLHAQLSAHPDIFLPQRKELEYFSYEPQHHRAGLTGYLDNFREAKATDTIGETTASYFWSHSSSPWCDMPYGFETNIPLSIRQQLGSEVKIVVALRNPVRRAISAYLHYCSMGQVSPSSRFQDNMKYMGVIDMGFYGRHLANWLDVFDPSQVLVLTLEHDIRAEPEKTMSRLHTFLEVENHQNDLTSLQKTIYPGLPTQTKQDGVYAKIELDNTHTGSQGTRSPIGLTRILSSLQLSELKQIYREDIAQLDTLLGTLLSIDWGLSY